MTAIMSVYREFSFNAGHHLPMLPPSHKCSRRHGHNYRFRLHVQGPLDPTLGWVTDFGGLLKAAGELVTSVLDHQYLNDIPGLENPTAENLALWIAERVRITQLGEGKVHIWQVEVFETDTTGVSYCCP